MKWTCWCLLDALAKLVFLCHLCCQNKGLEAALKTHCTGSRWHPVLPMHVFLCCICCFCPVTTYRTTTVVRYTKEISAKCYLTWKIISKLSFQSFFLSFVFFLDLTAGQHSQWEVFVERIVGNGRGRSFHERKIIIKTHQIYRCNADHLKHGLVFRSFLY